MCVKKWKNKQANKILAKKLHTKRWNEIPYILRYHHQQHYHIIVVVVVVVVYLYSTIYKRSNWNVIVFFSIIGTLYTYERCLPPILCVHVSMFVCVYVRCACVKSARCWCFTTCCASWPPPLPNINKARYILQQQFGVVCWLLCSKYEIVTSKYVMDVTMLTNCSNSTKLIGYIVETVGVFW